MAITLEFLGAARHVTGSRHLLTVGDRRILLDCGMVQGPRRVSDQANRDLKLDAKAVDAVVLSHAHIDHSGSLPRLVKLGFDGPIFCTSATESLVSVLLGDSAHIQASDARFLAKRGHRYEPPYTVEDVERTVSRLRGIDYRQRKEVVPGVTVEFFDAGHILGSAMVHLTIEYGGEVVRVGFTGDHGRAGMPILRDPEKLPPCEFFLTESTYGDRTHPPTPDLENTLADIVNEEMEDGGRIVIPAFSIGRTQNVVLFLGNLMSEGRIPELPIFIDSPLSTRATKIMAGHPEVFDDETRAIVESGRHPFFYAGARYVADVEESKSLNDVRTGVIISASGMCEAGRVLHHLRQSVGRQADCVLMVGYQARGTLGRRLVDGHENVKIFGDRFRVRCKVRSMSGMSAHADHVELLANTRHLAAHAECVFVIHGEDDAATVYADRLVDAGFRRVEVPVKRQKFVLRD